MRVVAVIVALLVVLASHGAEADPLEIETGATWMTPGQPEVHVLLRNSSDQAVDFTLWLGRGRGKRRVECAQDLRTVDPSFYRRFDRLIGISQVMTSGIVPARGWAHRAFPVGAGGSVPPCRVPFSMQADGADVIEGEIEVPAAPPADSALSPGEASISPEVMVERDRLDRRRVIIRLLVRNNGPKPTRVSITDREIHCSDATVNWALHYGAVQGEDVGPTVVAPGGWAVFVDAANLADEAKVESCRGKIQLSAFVDGDMAPVARAEFSLVPTGEFGIPNVRER